MDVEDISELREHFFDEVKLQKVRRKDARTRGLALNRKEFIEAVEAVAGGASLAKAAGSLFDILDAGCEGTVTWEQVLDGIIENMEPGADRLKSFWKPVDPDVKIHTAAHCKREPIVKIAALETKSAFCYAVVSRLGRVGVYDGEFNLHDSYKLALKPNEETKRSFRGGSEEKQRRSQTTWVADVVYVSDSNCLLYASSDRSLHMYDAKCLIHIPLCRIIGLQNVPTCMEYFASNISNQPSLLFVGDDNGDIITMKFHQPRMTLFKKKHPDKLDYYYWSELHEQSDYVTFSTEVHIDGRRQPYVFKVTRGIRCFHYERSMHIVATGSNDFVVRIWNEVVSKQPVISLYGHRAPVVDVCIVKYMSAVISLSREGVVKVWDVNDYYCQMTLPLQFPILKVIGARVDFGTRSIYPGPKTMKEVSNETPTSKDGSSATGVIGIGLDEVETQMSIMDLEKRCEDSGVWRHL
ncbi:UNVERIFIED_CONTAM: hypothetical protein PYX00_000083 [Menopon gallinae]|uniref:WD repeat-containing protein on Y chromosome n=1 Tax=Menopon gallinae TaxID=328185 RepID=A0AAW2I739_9NEOP